MPFQNNRLCTNVILIHPDHVSIHRSSESDDEVGGRWEEQLEVPVPGERGNSSVTVT